MKNITMKFTLFTIVLCMLFAVAFSACSLTDDPASPARPSQTSADSGVGNESPVNTPEEIPAQTDEDAVGEPEGPFVAVYVGNYLYEIVPFDEQKVIKVDQGNNRINEVTLTGEAVYMSHSTCDNQDCVKQGEITKENHETRVLMDWVICLPNQVTIEYISEDK